MIKYFIGFILFLFWILILKVLSNAKLDFWKFIFGGIGLFLFLFVFIEPVLTDPLAKLVALVASLPGKIGHMYQAYYKYGTIFIDSDLGAITLQIDFECSGIIEIMAFVSLLAFFKVYSVTERIVVGVVGVLLIIFSNAFRIFVICTMIHFGGINSYYLAHTFVGRFVFYVLTVLLYFYVFTKPQILKQKVGKFGYDNN